MLARSDVQILCLKTNGALCDLVTEVEEKVIQVKEERKFLLLKLYQFDPALSKYSNGKIYWAFSQ